jgi:hypothetical protein
VRAARSPSPRRRVGEALSLPALPPRQGDRGPRWRARSSRACSPTRPARSGRLQLPRLPRAA